ncbi:hypothetical protein NIES2119_30930, partial [[Phormidium ambiguum] IAM M-71]
FPVLHNLTQSRFLLSDYLAQYYQQSLAKIDQAYKAVVANLIAKYEKLGNLAEAAFDPKLNLELRLQASIKLAQAYSVPDSKIIHNLDELDSFMLS